MVSTRVSYGGVRSNLMACGKVQKHPKRGKANPLLLVSTASTSLEIEEMYYCVQTLSNGEVKQVLCIKKTPALVKLYREQAGATDHANHMRQGGLKQGTVPLEDVIGTMDYKIHHPITQDRSWVR